MLGLGVSSNNNFETSGQMVEKEGGVLSGHKGSFRPKEGPFKLIGGPQTDRVFSHRQRALSELQSQLILAKSPVRPADGNLPVP